MRNIISGIVVIGIGIANGSSMFTGDPSGLDYAFDLIARPALEAYGKMAAFDALKNSTSDAAILTMLVTSGLSHLPPMKVVTILSGVVSFDLKWFIASAIVARGARFYLLAFLLQRYGLAMVAYIERRFMWVGAIVIGLAVLAYVGLKLL